MNIFRSPHLRTFFTFIILLMYAVLRYNIFGHIPWKDVPLFIVNKAISLTTVFLLFSTTSRKEKVKERRKELWKTIFILTSIHVFISFKLLDPEYFRNFYSADTLNLFGYLSISFGILAFIGIIVLNGNKILPTKNGNFTKINHVRRIVQKIIPILIMGHLITIGVRGWLSPYTWHGYLFPISLIAFLLMVGYMLRTKQK